MTRYELNWLPKHYKPLIQLNLSIVLIPLVKFPLPGDRKHSPSISTKSKTRTMAFSTLGGKTKCGVARNVSPWKRLSLMCICKCACWVLMGRLSSAQLGAAGGRAGGRRPNSQHSFLTSRSGAVVVSDECGRWTRVWRVVCEVMTLSLAAALFANRAPSSAAAKAKNDPPTEWPTGRLRARKINKGSAPIDPLRRVSHPRLVYNTHCARGWFWFGLYVRVCALLSSCAPECMRCSFEASAPTILWQSCDIIQQTRAALQMHSVLIGKGCRYQRIFYVEIFASKINYLI